jgi:hypothetical protein
MSEAVRVVVEAVQTIVAALGRLVELPGVLQA